MAYSASSPSRAAAKRREAYLRWRARLFADPSRYAVWLKHNAGAV